MANNTTVSAATTFPATQFPGRVSSIARTPPPFPAPPRSVDLSPLKFILAVVAVIAVPAIAYALFFAVPCPSRRRRSSSTAEPSPPPPPPPATGVKFQKESHSKEIGNECPVCLSVFADGEEVRQLSACKHAFHASCIDTWLSDHSSCPVCRAAVNVRRHDGEVNGNRNGVGGGNRRVSATNRTEDWHQGLPDSSSLV